MEGVSEIDRIESSNQEQVFLSRKSWVAYIVPLLFAVFVISIGISAGGMSGMVILVFGFAMGIVSFLHLRSVELYFDQDGVWVFSGIFPWNKGRNGVRWRDLSEASYFTGFISWATRSWSIRIGHRFTKTSEILLSNMTGSPEAASKINNIHQEQIRSGILTG